MSQHWPKCLFLICFLFVDSFCFLSKATGVLDQSFGFIKKHAYCRYIECCTKEYIPDEVPGFSEIFGQHIAISRIREALHRQYDNTANSKPLVMSFHGTPGVGKNYVVDHIVNSRYKEGFKSKYVHIYRGRMHFPLTSKVEEYSATLLGSITKRLKDCPYQMFIFDEVDKMPPGIFDSIASLLDHNVHWQNVDMSKSVFVFISNVGGVGISEQLYKLMNKGWKREDTQLHHFESILEKIAYNTVGGLYKSGNIIQKAVIDYFIPFLPLEERHVIRCIKKYVGSTDDEVIKEVLKYVVFEDTTNIFAASGCKKLQLKAQSIALGIRRKRAGNEL